MREIKFKVWNEETQAMFATIDNAKDLYLFRNEEGIVLLQYTGLKDKNGKEIYEGDILDCTCELLTNFGRTTTGKMGTTIYEVFWRKEGWGKKVLKSDTLVVGKDSDGLAITAKYSEVIGNTYEGNLTKQSM